MAANMVKKCKLLIEIPFQIIKKLSHFEQWSEFVRLKHLKQPYMQYANVKSMFYQLRICSSIQPLIVKTINTTQLVIILTNIHIQICLHYLRKCIVQLIRYFTFSCKRRYKSIPRNSRWLPRLPPESEKDIIGVRNKLQIPICGLIVL